MSSMKDEPADSDDSSSSLSGDEACAPVKQLVSWVCCDLCSKWRRVPQVYAQSLNPDAPWCCSDNPDKAMADCSRPQELSNEEIDAMSADAEDVEEADISALLEERGRRRRTPAVWQLIKDNILTYRKRKVQEEDDVMICNCRPARGDKKGDNCGPDCINRMLCVECCSGFCPCEMACTNQMFTRKQYAKLEVRRAGAKGFGLFAVEPIVASQFIIEYIGEVLDDEEYVRRKEFYGEVGQRHYYFMNIGNGEVIDACRKGNRARFINHSCDPNCETQKWLVKGELAIGLFAVKDVAAGEELTFDYNFERYGDKPIRCYCGSKTCRRFIGGTQDNIDDSLVPFDPEDATNDFQPIMLVDQDMDVHMKALLDWRVGVFWDKDKEAAVLKGLERVCKSRGVGWTPAHYHGAAQVPVADAAETMAEPAEAAGRGTRRSGKVAAAAGKKAGLPERKGRAAGRAGDDEDDDDEDDEGPGPASRARGAVEGADAASGAVPHSSALSAALRSSTRRPGSSAATASGRTDASLISSTTLLSGRRTLLSGGASDRDAQGGVSSSQVSVVTHLRDSIQQRGPPARADSREREAREAQSRGDLADAGQGVTSVRRKVVLDPGVPRSRAKRRSEIDRRLDVLVGPSGRMRDTSRQNIIKVLRMFNLCDISMTRAAQRPVVDWPVALSSSATTGPDATPAQLDLLPPPELMPLEPTQPYQDPSTCAGSQPPTGPLQASDADTLSIVQPSGQSQLPPGDAQPSDVHVKLEPGPVQGPGQVVVKPDAARSGVGDAVDGAGGGGDAATGVYMTPSGPVPLVPSPAPLPVGLGVSKGVQGPPAGPQQLVEMTARQRARMADLSLLLDVILKTSSATIRRQFVTCGVLNQLHQAITRNFNKQYVTSLRSFIKDYSVILRKVLKVVEALPITADDLYTTRTAHCRLADTLQDLTAHEDFDVRGRALGLLKKYPLSAVTDPGLLQRHTARAGGSGKQHVDGQEGGSGITRTGRIMQPLSLHTAPIELLPPAFVCPASPQAASAAADSDVLDVSGAARVRRRELHEVAPHNQGPVQEAWADEEAGQEGFVAGQVFVNTTPHLVSHQHVLNKAPVTAEELYEVLYLPSYVVERHPGYEDPVPSLTPLPTAECGIHGEVTDMEALYAAGLFDMDWVAAISVQPAARRQRKGWDVVAPVIQPVPRYDTLDTPRQAPTSPLRALTLSPVRYDVQQAEVAAEEARQAALRQAAGVTAGGAATGAAAVSAAPAVAPVVKPIAPPIDPDVAEWARAPKVQAVDTWDEPDDGFQEFVRETVRFRLGKYVTQQDHHSKIKSEAAHALFKKIQREIIAKEQQAFGERQRMGMFKIIEKTKVEHNIKEFVRHSIKRYLQTQTTSTQPNGA